MKKSLFVAVFIVLVLSLSFNVFWLLSDENNKNSEENEDKSKICFTLDEELLNYNTEIDNGTEVTDFNYDINENDEVRVYLYEYTKDGVNHMFSSKKQLEPVSDVLIDDIEALLTKINGKHATHGFLLGPVSTVRIVIDSSEYKMEIRLGNGFITVDSTHNGIQKVLTIENELDIEVEELIRNIKSDY